MTVSGEPASPVRCHSDSLGNRINTYLDILALRSVDITVPLRHEDQSRIRGTHRSANRIANNPSTKAVHSLFPAASWPRNQEVALAKTKPYTLLHAKSWQTALGSAPPAVKLGWDTTYPT